MMLTRLKKGSVWGRRDEIGLRVVVEVLNCRGPHRDVMWEWLWPDGLQTPGATCMERTFCRWAHHSVEVTP